MPELGLILPDHPPESKLDTIPFILGAVDCVFSTLEYACVMELSIALGALTGPLAAAAGVFMALGAPYDEIINDITWRELSFGFSLGLVTAADGVTAKKAAEFFGHRVFERNIWVHGGAKAASEAYVKGLLSGFSQGRALNKGQRLMLWQDLLSRAKTMPGWADYQGQAKQSKQWKATQWINYYRFFGAIFRQFHMQGEG